MLGHGQELKHNFEAIKLEEKKDNYYWTYLYNEKIGNFEFVEEAKLVPKPPTKIETGWGFE